MTETIVAHSIELESENKCFAQIQLMASLIVNSWEMSEKVNSLIAQ